jgi:hypothetical protein
MLEWMRETEFLWWSTVIGTAVFFVMLLVLPLLAIRLPADYLQRKSTARLEWSGLRSVARSAGIILRNALAYVMIAGAIPLLVLPGPGITLLFVGMLLADFPYKRRMVHWMLQHGTVHRLINDIRRRAQRAPLVVPTDGRAR